MRRALAIVATLAALLLLPLSRVTAAEPIQVPAAPEGRVNDYAGVLDPAQRQALERQLLGYELAARDGNPLDRDSTGDRRGAPQIAVVLLPSLGGEPIEDVSIRFGEKWKIGSKADDGVLLVVGVAEHKIRIEVGYGAEGRLPDALASRIIRELIAPRLHRDDFAGGLHTGVAAIHQALTGQPVTGVDNQSGPRVPPGYGKRVGGGGLGLFLLIILLLLISRGRGGGGFLAGMMLGSLFGGRRDGGGGGGGFSGGGGGFGGGGASGDY